MTNNQSINPRDKQKTEKSNKKRDNRSGLQTERWENQVKENKRKDG